MTQAVVREANQHDFFDASFDITAYIIVLVNFVIIQTNIMDRIPIIRHWSVLIVATSEL